MDHKSAFADHSLVRFQNEELKWEAICIVIVFRVDGSVNAEKNERLERSKAVKTVYTSVFQRYPFVTVRIKPEALRPTEEFKNAVSNALAQPAHKKRDALDKVFNLFGHAIQVEFDLGALMVKTSSTKISTEVGM